MHWSPQHTIQILNIFTQFPLHDSLPQYTQQYLKRSGYSNPSNFARKRLQEDTEALKALKVSVKNLSYPDGGFRNNKNQAVYPTTRSLFSGKPHPKDLPLTQELAQRLQSKEWQKFDRIMVPLGVGKHNDHIIVRSAAEQAFLPSKICYYWESPYLLTRNNWSLDFIFQTITHLQSVRFTSFQKKALLQQYGSQINILFPHGIPTYPEIIIGS